jgi:L-fucose mutarotase
MLKGIPKIIPPDLLKILMEMGHGDDLVIGDGNFPHASCARRLVRCDGHNVPELLDAILRLFPLDTYVEKPLGLLAVVPGDPTKPKRWEEFRAIAAAHDPNFTDFDYIERFAFYERAKSAYAVVATGDQALYSCVLLKKGVIPGE